MSVHLQTVPNLFGMNPESYFMNIAGHGAKVVKVNTDITDYDLMQDILANSTLGFKSKLDLINFQKRCIVYFKYNGQTIDITFIGDFDNFEVRNFVSTLNQEFKEVNNKLYSNNRNNPFLEKLNQSKKEKELKDKMKQEKDKNERDKNKLESIKIKKEKNEINEVIEDKSKEEINIKETTIPENQFIISSNLKDKNIINQILSESYVGYDSKEELEKFQNIGKISFNKTIKETFDFVFIGDYDEEEAKKYVENITEEYALIVQEQTYLKVIEKIKNENLNLESEIVDKDDSIVLTINI